MKTYDIEEAKIQLEQLLAAAAIGEEVVITKDGIPTVRVVSIQPEVKPERTFGLMKGKVWIADDFDAPLPPELLADFEGR